MQLMLAIVCLFAGMDAMPCCWYLLSSIIVSQICNVISDVCALACVMVSLMPLSGYYMLPHPAPLGLLLC